MKYKKLLLIVFFVSLFVIQQAQASANIYSETRTVSQLGVAQGFVPYCDPNNQNDTSRCVWISIYHLIKNSDGSTAGYAATDVNGNPIECDPLLLDNAFGCTDADGSAYSYPYTINPAYVDIENDYLLDVLSREMDPHDNPHENSQHAQAIAARSFAYYWARSTPSWILENAANRTRGQVFIPFAFDNYLSTTPGSLNIPDNINEPCQSSNLNAYQTNVCNAVNAANDYIVRHDTGEYAKTLFFSDWVGDTRSDGSGLPYLQGVNDPISTGCDPNPVGHGWGMSQKGANRWALGNQCSTGGGAAWPVTWTDYRQILVHYYTGIDILNGSGTKVAPDDRWNLLWHNNFGAQFGQKPELQSDQPSTLQIRFQNTSVNLWTANSLEIGYRWYQNGQPIPSDPNWHAVDGEHPEIPVGKEYPPLSPTLVEPLSVPIIAPSYEGDYTLHLDLRHKTPNQSVNDGWFSQQTPAWPDATIDVHVNGPTATPTFTPEPTVTPTATPVITAYFHGPVGPYCVGGGCAAPTGYNNVLTPPTRNEQSMQANDPSAGLLGGGRVETKILVDGGGIGTLRMYYGLSGESCPAGNELQVSKVSGNVRYYNVPSTGYLDVNLAQVDGGGFILYTRCKTTTGYTGSYGIDSVWHSFVPDSQPPSTPQPPTCVKKCFYEACTYASGSTDREPARAKLASLSQGLIFTIRNFDRITDQAALLYRVRDEILDTNEEGQRYIDLYYAHSEEIAAILDADSELADQGLDVVDTLTPGLQALLDGQGNTVVITSEQIQQAQAFLDALIPYASPELQHAIADERSRQPLEQLAGMTMLQAWVHLQDFPATAILDNFNRADGPLGGNWSGDTSSYVIVSNQLHFYEDATNDLYWGPTSFGADQEVYVTFAHVDPQAGEQDLVLKAQSNTYWGAGLLEVMYDAASQRAQVWSWDWPAGWVQHGADIPVAFADGDQFGARALANGTVEVYRNGELLATRDASAWSHSDEGGYIGLWLLDADVAILDDFGGGTVADGPGEDGSSVEGESLGSNLEEADSFNMELSDFGTFWQGIPLGAGQEAVVAFTRLEQAAGWQKPQSNGVWGDHVVQVLYDAPEQRIQVWMYAPGKGWVQSGRDISVIFRDGDRFRVVTRPGGVLEIYCNGKLLAKREVGNTTLY